MIMKVLFCSHNYQQRVFPTFLGKTPHQEQEHPVFDSFECRKKYGCYANLDDYMAYAKLKKSDIKGIAGRGGLSVILDLGENEVLKCSLENPLEFREHIPSFDIPFLSPVKKFGQTYFVREPKAETKGITPKDCEDVIRRIYEAGYEPSADLYPYATRQIGIYNGKPYLLDTRCAVPQPNRFSKFVYDFCHVNCRVLIAHKVDPYDFSFQHIDETPRPNLSLKKGLAKIFNMMKLNMKYGKKPFSFESTIAMFLLRK